uniref:Retrovirus-related Pol polyprotein from transposon TNT 1-94 n=1 Tax=Tanacetum cinerariifolium TaxID=118510 RepID=A0A6L2JJE3_TANCI|nr:retrovirus-related Pol polyprotein from transposon TNT 1-94 [Tanacetum cinerariifolium]
MIMSFIKMVESQNDVKVKQIRTYNGTEFINHELESFCDEKGISRNFYFPYTPKKNGVAKRKNKTLIEHHLGKFDAKADDGYFLGYSFVSKAFRVFNTRRLEVEKTYHVTFDENSNVSYYVITHGHSLIELTQENLVPEVIALNDPDIPLTKDNKGPFDLINTERTHEQNVQKEQITNQPTKGPLGKNTKNSDRWSKDKHIELVNIIGDLAEGMRTRSMAAKPTAATTIDMMEAIRIFLTFATYINFKVHQMDVKSAFLNGKLKEKVYIKRPPRFESIEFSYYVCKLDKALYRLKEAPKACSSVKTPMVPLNNLGPDLFGKSVNETPYRGIIGSLMYLTATRPDIYIFVVLCAVYQSNPKELHLTAMKRILKYLKVILTLGLYYPKCSGFNLKGNSDLDYALVIWIENAPKVPAKFLVENCRVLRNNTMAEEQAIVYAPQWNNMTVDNVSFQTNNVVVNSGTVPNPQDLERNVQLASMGLPSTLDEGTRKSQPLIEGPLGDKDSEGNKPPTDMEPIHPNVNDPSGTGELDAQPLVLSTYADVRAFLLSGDKAQESKEAILGIGDEIDEDSQTTVLQHQSSPHQANKPQSFTTSYTKASNSDSSSDDLLKIYDNILLLTER